MSKHEFDPGWTGLSTQCNHLVVKPGTTYADTCGMPRGNAIHFQPDEQCVGCLTGHDIGLPSSAVAYPHPECPVHGDTESEPLSPEQEEVIAAGAYCWCGGEVGPRVPGDVDGLGCLSDIHHDWHGRIQDGDKVDAMALSIKAVSRLSKGLDVPRSLIEGDWLMKNQECAFNPGSSCQAVMDRGNGHCCFEYEEAQR